MLEQGCLLGIVGRYVGLQQHRIGQLGLHRWVAEGVFLKLFAGDTPVGVQIQHHRLALRLLQRLVKLLNVIDTGEIQMRLGRLLRSSAAECPVLQWARRNHQRRQQQHLDGSCPATG
ncbi:hypothetical protein D3C80_1871320 [compost metagenome]